MNYWSTMKLKTTNEKKFDPNCSVKSKILLLELLNIEPNELYCFFFVLWVNNLKPLINNFKKSTLLLLL